MLSHFIVCSHFGKSAILKMHTFIYIFFLVKMNMPIKFEDSSTFQSPQTKIHLLLAVGYLNIYTKPYWFQHEGVMSLAQSDQSGTMIGPQVPLACKK